ncbi:hypothetical protein [Sodalis sp.]|uniref:hypothetical protein n=1 Tax=Sodalis sp. (in: enterobacteria) TaxID=1898979 RepID=UPI003873C3A0
MRIDAALANVTTLLTPVPSRPSKNAQHDAATGWQPATPSGSPPRRLHNPQRDTAAGAYPSRQSPSSPVTLRRPRDPVAAVASQAPPRPPKPSPLTAGTCGDSSRMYAQIDYEALPTFRSTGITFVPYDKTVYATLHGPEPLISDAHGAPEGRVHSWIDFSVERKKHAAFAALTSRIKQLVGDKVIPCKYAPPADALDNSYIWADRHNHYQLRLRHHPHAYSLGKLENLPQALQRGQQEE